MMNQETLDKIEKLEKAISSTKTPDSLKEKMRQALETLKSEKVEVAEPSLATEVKTITKYTDIKSCLLDDGDDNDDYIYEGKQIHNVETLPKDTWEIVEFYNNGVVLKHIPTSVLADNKPDKNVSFSELKTLFAVGKIEIDGIENGNTKVFNLCIKAIIKCISNIDEISNKKAVISELTLVKNDLEKNIEKANALENEKSELLNKNSDLEKTSNDKISFLERESKDKISSLESSISDEKSSFEKAKIMADLETANLKKKLEDLEALNIVRSVIDMLNDDVMKKDLKELHTSDREHKAERAFPKEKIKVKEIKIHKAEGKVEGYGLPKIVNSYEEANDAIMPVYEDSVESGGYSNKGGFTVFFEDGEVYNGDLFIGEKYDNPTKGNVVGKHIKKYLEREINENRQSEETAKEIKEFLEKYDLGFDDAIISVNGDYKDINSFIDYVNDFYGKDGIYAKDFKNNGFTKDEIKVAVSKYISDIDKRDDDNFTWGSGDSVDRERVRTYLENMDSEKHENGGEIYPDDKVIITTSSLGEKYKGMQGAITSRKLLDDKYSVKLEDGMEMAFTKDEFRHNSVNPRFENGGGVYNENAEMLLNNNKQIKHHTEELNKVVNSNTEVPAWVVAKVNRSSSDLSDATHYLEGVNTEFKNGGEIESDIKNLVGKWIDISYMGIDDIDYKTISSTSVTPERFTHRDVIIEIKDGTESRFPISQLNDFLSGKDIVIKGGKEPYVISLSKN